MKKMCKSFYYDKLFLIDANDSALSAIDFLKKTKEDKILGISVDHRCYNIQEKNIIKHLIEEFDIDNLHFTFRPSAINHIINLGETELEKFKYFSRIIFAINSLIVYDIKEAIVPGDFLNGVVNDEIEFNSVCNQLTSYLTNLNKILLSNNPNINFNKLFPVFATFINLNFTGVSKNIKVYRNTFTSTQRSKLLFRKSILESEKYLFWLGFDPEFKEVPWKKEYYETKWTKIANDSKTGIAIYEQSIKYCTRCCMPETMEGISFDEFGICTPCRSSEEKMHINWEERETKLKDIINSHFNPDYYDCLLPMSGGKDSMFQAHILVKKYNITPLAVTHGMNWLSLTGRYNLENCLQKFDLDHLFFTSNRSTINKVAKKSLTEIGDACWHCHIGNGAFVIQTAVAWNLGLMIWGESIAERDGRGSYIDQKEASIYYNLEVSGKVKAEEMIDNEIDEKELSKWFYPRLQEIDSSRLRYLHLGDFMFWDEERQVDYVVEKYEWMNSKVENSFKGYKSNECVMAGVHDYSNFIKRGIGRSTIQASDDIRRGLITREEGIEIAKHFDSQRPHALDFYLKITGYSEEEFEDILIEARKLSKDASKLK